MIPPPKRLKVADIPPYLKAKYNLEISRQSVYNWMNKGIRNETLPYITVKAKPTAQYPTIRVVTERQIDEFLHRCGIQFQQS